MEPDGLINCRRPAALRPDANPGRRRTYRTGDARRRAILDAIEAEGGRATLQALNKKLGKGGTGLLHALLDLTAPGGPVLCGDGDQFYLRERR